MNNDFAEFSVYQACEQNYSKARQYDLDERAFQVVHSPEVAYWIGFLMADGCVNDHTNVTLCLSLKDIEHMRKYKMFMKTDRPIYTYYHKKSGTSRCTLALTSKRIVRDLGRYGVIKNKGGKEQLKNIPPEYIRDFILGYFDGDGCICRAGNSVVSFSIATSSFELITKIQEILMYQCDLNKTKLHKKLYGTYVMTYGGQRQVRRIYEFLYERGEGSQDYLMRKKDKFLP